jgi:hypothetical protein
MMNPAAIIVSAMATNHFMPGSYIALRSGSPPRRIRPRASTAPGRVATFRDDDRSGPGRAPEGVAAAAAPEREEGMAGYGSWDDRPWERREGGERDRWRHERQRWARREEDPWREGAEEDLGARGREEWHARPAWRGEEGEGRWGGRDWERDERGWGRERRSAEDERWARRGYGGVRPEIDPPWVEPGPRARGRGETRGLVEWEDRGPLAWLGDRARRRGKASRGPKGYTRSDERIHDEVCERIARSGVDAGEVEVRVENRQVTLAGTVRDREEKWWLEDLADDVFGVEEVHNHLRVVRGEAPGTGAEGGIRH